MPNYVSDSIWLERPAIVGGFSRTSPSDGRPDINASNVAIALDTGHTVLVT